MTDRSPHWPSCEAALPAHTDVPQEGNSPLLSQPLCLSGVFAFVQELSLYSDQHKLFSRTGVLREQPPEDKASTSHLDTGNMAGGEETDMGPTGWKGGDPNCARARHVVKTNEI